MRDMYKEGWQYITCYDFGDGHLIPMGHAKNLKYATEIAKQHKHILCKFIRLKDYRDKKHSWWSFRLRRNK